MMPGDRALAWTAFWIVLFVIALLAVNPLALVLDGAMLLVSLVWLSIEIVREVIGR